MSIVVRIMECSRRWLAVGALVLMAACGGATESETPTAEAPPASPAVSEEASAQAPAPAEEPSADPAPAAEEPAGVQESTSAEAPGGGEQLKLASAAPGPEPKWRFREGQDFKVLTSAQGVTSSPDKIEVAEAFWYGCSHCYQFEPRINDYAAKLPGDVAFVRIPVMWNPTNQIHARLFYTAQVLGKLDEMHTPIFREIHVNKNMLVKEEDIQRFFERFGVGAADFQKTFRSFAVDGLLNRARELTERYQVRSVPMLIVNGKYNTDAPGIKNFDMMLEVTDELIERERRRR